MRPSSPHHCPVCGAVVPDDAPDGVCSRCLLQAAMQPTGPEEHGRPEPPSLAAVSAAFPQLEILELIGYDGMGAVFKARQPKLDPGTGQPVPAQDFAALNIGQLKKLATVAYDEFNARLVGGAGADVENLIAR